MWVPVVLGWILLQELDWWALELPQVVLVHLVDLGLLSALRLHLGVWWGVDW